MQDSRSSLSVCCATLLFIVLSFSQVYGENFFRWTDDAGRLCYSNVSPPADIKTFSVATVLHPVSDRSNPVRVSVNANAEEQIQAGTDTAFSTFSTLFLKQRITDRRRTIGHIEVLLRKHPDNSVLRRSLLKKRRYLFEDLIQLKNIQP